MTRRGILIEDRRRLSLAFRWRDRCLTVALVGVWWHPFDALRHLIASEAFRWNVFVADLADVLTVGTPRLTGLARRSSTPGREASARSCGSWRARAGAEPEPPADDPCG